MESSEMLDKAMNSGYKFLMGDDSIFEKIEETDEMIFIPDPEMDDYELADDLIEYFIDTEEYEKCANIRDMISLKKMINKLI